MSLKVSDEYTVPLCHGHHDAVHRTGDERAWWASRDIDPLAVADRLWSATDKTEEISLERVPATGSSHDSLNGSQGNLEEAPKVQDPTAEAQFGRSRARAFIRQASLISAIG